MDLSTIKDLERNMTFQRKSSNQILDLIADLRTKDVKIGDTEALEHYCTDIRDMAQKALDLAKLAEPYYKEAKKDTKKVIKAEKKAAQKVDDVEIDDDMSFLE